MKHKAVQTVRKVNLSGRILLIQVFIQTDRMLVTMLVFSIFKMFLFNDLQNVIDDYKAALYLKFKCYIKRCRILLNG